MYCHLRLFKVFDAKIVYLLKTNNSTFHKEATSKYKAEIDLLSPYIKGDLFYEYFFALNSSTVSNSIEITH